MLYFSLVFLEPFIKLKADAAAVFFSEKAIFLALVLNVTYD